MNLTREAVARALSWVGHSSVSRPRSQDQGHVERLMTMDYWEDGCPVFNRILSNVTHHAQDALTERQCEVLVRRTSETYAEIARGAGVSPVRIRQIEVKAARKVRHIYLSAVRFRWGDDVLPPSAKL